MWRRRHAFKTPRGEARPPSCQARPGQGHGPLARDCLLRRWRKADAGRDRIAAAATFSAQAVEFASRIPQRVILIDGRRLTELMVEHGVGVRSGRVLEFKRLDEDFFSED